MGRWPERRCTAYELLTQESAVLGDPVVARRQREAPLDGNRLQPDIAAANPSFDDYQTSHDPQLEAALVALRTMR